MRYQERKADQYAIRFAKTPEELERESKFYQKKHTQFVESTHTRSPLILAADLSWSTHPSFLERAQYFQEAADALREKQQKKDRLIA
jgi:Zn-dependent protease with chaperone function